MTHPGPCPFGRGIVTSAPGIHESMRSIPHPGPCPGGGGFLMPSASGASERIAICRSAGPVPHPGPRPFGRGFLMPSAPGARFFARILHRFCLTEI